MTPAKKKGRSEASVFLDNLSEFLGDCEGQDLNDVKSYLREEGIDVEDFLSKVRVLIAEKSSEARRSWIKEAKAGHAAALEKMKHFVTEIPEDEASLKERIKQLISGGEGWELATAYFRNFKDMPFEDLKKLYEDYLKLKHIKETGIDDRKDSR